MKNPKLVNAIQINKTLKLLYLQEVVISGGCPLASRLPTVLWPVAGRSAIEYLLCLKRIFVKK